jgi:alkaline phosphatase
MQCLALIAWTIVERPRTLRSERRHGNDRRTSRAARPEKSAARAGSNQVTILFGNGDYDFSDQRARGRKSRRRHDLLPELMAK